MTDSLCTLRTARRQPAVRAKFNHTHYSVLLLQAALRIAAVRPSVRRFRVH